MVKKFKDPLSRLKGKKTKKPLIKKIKATYKNNPPLMITIGLIAVCVLIVLASIVSGLVYKPKTQIEIVDNALNASRQLRKEGKLKEAAEVLDEAVRYVKLPQQAVTLHERSARFKEEVDDYEGAYKSFIQTLTYYEDLPPIELMYGAARNAEATNKFEEAYSYYYTVYNRISEFPAEDREALRQSIKTTLEKLENNLQS